MHVCINVCSYLGTHAFMYACMYACMHACMHVCMYVRMQSSRQFFPMRFSTSKTTPRPISSANFSPAFFGYLTQNKLTPIFPVHYGPLQQNNTPAKFVPCIFGSSKAKTPTMFSVPFWTSKTEQNSRHFFQCNFGPSQQNKTPTFFPRTFLDFQNNKAHANFSQD